MSPSSRATLSRTRTLGTTHTRAPVADSPRPLPRRRRYMGAIVATTAESARTVNVAVETVAPVSTRRTVIVAGPTGRFRIATVPPGSVSVAVADGARLEMYTVRLIASAV